MTQDQTDDIGGVRAECHSDAELSRSLSDVERQKPVNARCREGEPDETEDADQSGAESLAGDVLSQPGTQRILML